eukprot:3765952-Amphidinium_carterae.2
MQTLSLAHRDGHNRLSQRDAFRMHGEHWHRLSGEAPKKFNMEAATKKAQVDKELHEAFQNVTHRLEMLALQEESSASNDDKSAAMLFSAAPLNLERFHVLQDYYDELKQANKTMKDYVKKLASALEPLDDEVMANLKAQTLIVRAPRVQYCNHARLVIHLRQHFAKAVFLIPGKESQLYPFKFVFANLNPLSLELLCLENIDVQFVEPLPSKATLRESALQDITFMFQVKDAKRVTNSDVLGCAEVRDILVVQSTPHTARGWISRDYAENLAYVLTSLEHEIPPRLRTTHNTHHVRTAAHVHIYENDEEEVASGHSDEQSDVERMDDDGHLVHDAFDSTHVESEARFNRLWNEVEEARTVLEEHTDVSRDDFRPSSARSAKSRSSTEIGALYRE